MDDMGLQLNLSSEGPVRQEKRKRQRVVVKKGHRRKKVLYLPVKQKQGTTQHPVPQKPLAAVKRDRETGDRIVKDSPSKQPEAAESPGNKRKQAPADTDQQQPAKKQKSTHVISSLFKNNPEIPTVTSKTVTQVKEEVFSGKAFKDLPLHQFMVANLEEKMGFKQMTSVQKATIPAILKGKDVMVKSQTGSGKTLAYAVPVVQELQDIHPKLRRGDGIHALVIVPTRELAIQSYETFLKIVKPFVWLVPGCLMGGEKKKAEKARLRKGFTILVATPGRLLDHIKHTASLNLARVKYLVIDEADRLLEMGFERDVSQIITSLKEQSQNHQTLLLSATLTQGVERLAGMSIQSPVKISISDEAEEQGTAAAAEATDDSKENEDFAIPQKLRQHYVVVPSKLRLVTLTAFILWKAVHDTKKSKMIVFMSTQDSVEYHYNLLTKTICHSISGSQKRIPLYRLHGDMDQKERTEVYQKFTEAKSGVLFCTDVAARGLHLPATRWILQYNCPGSTTDYIHRVGRTARAGSQGSSLLFLAPHEAEYIKTLNELKLSLTEIAMEDVLKTLLLEAKDLSQRRGAQDQRVPKTVPEAATALQDVFETFVYSDQANTEAARKAYMSFIRAYATYPSSQKHLFHIKNLHLGHTAKSFGLREAPSHVAGMVGRKVASEKLKERTKQKKKKHVTSTKARVTEFSSGLVQGMTKATRKALGPKRKKKRLMKTPKAVK